jgi:hypothetical protein
MYYPQYSQASYPYEIIERLLSERSNVDARIMIPYGILIVAIFNYF